MSILNQAELEAMNIVNAALAAVQRIGGDALVVNHGEAIAATHVLQGFVIQHALERVEPETFGAWYRANDMAEAA